MFPLFLPVYLRRDFLELNSTSVCRWVAKTNKKLLNTWDEAETTCPPVLCLQMVWHSVKRPQTKFCHIHLMTDGYFFHHQVSAETTRESKHQNLNQAWWQKKKKLLLWRKEQQRIEIRKKKSVKVKCFDSLTVQRWLGSLNGVVSTSSSL